MPLFPLLFIMLWLLPDKQAAAADSLFEVSDKIPDLAQQSLDVLLQGSTFFFDSGVGQALYKGIRTIFAYYSMAVMVFAVLIVIYHVVAIIGETAHTGVPFGKRNKQMWSTIRLALALGLLAPVAGFNSAQYIIMHLARSGSSLATNAWRAFAEDLPVHNMTLHGHASVDPVTTIANLVAIGVCAKSYEIIGSGTPVAQILPAVGPPYLTLRVEEQKPVSRLQYSTSLGQNNSPPVGCGNLTWVPEEQLNSDVIAGELSAVYGRAHLGAIKKIQQRALDLGGSIALGAAGVPSSNRNVSYSSEFANLVKDYQDSFLDTVRAGLKLNDRNMFSVVSKSPTAVQGDFGWLTAAAALQKFALTDTILITPELASPVIAFDYALHGALNDKATVQISRSLSFAHVLLQHYNPVEPEKIWFNPQTDHGKGPFKQALILTAQILSRHAQTGQGFSPLDPGINGKDYGNASLFRPIALGFLSLDLADQFLAVAEWSPRANSPVFGASLIFNNMTQAVNQAFFAANPKFDAAQLQPPPVIHSDQPSDFARLLLIPIATMLFIPGLLLVFVLPLLPIVRFVIGALMWMLAIIQGLAAAPVWALTFLSLRGDGVMPQASRLGLTLIFNIFLRPILMVIGFIAALLLMHAGFGLLQICLQIFTFDGLIGSKTLFSLAPLILLITNLILSFGIANAALKCIDILPEVTLRWLGSSAVGIAGGDDAGASSGGAMAVAQGGGGGAATGNLAAMQASQAIWQRKLLNVLEQIMVHNGGTSSPQGNTGLFAHMADRPDQTPNASPSGSGGASASTASATAAVEVNHAASSAATTTSQSAYESPGTGSDGQGNKLAAQVIRGEQDGKKS